MPSAGIKGGGGRVGGLPAAMVVGIGSSEGTSPTAPTGGTITLSGTTVTIGWTDASANESEFQIQRSVDGGAYEDLDTVGPGVQTYDDESLSDGSTYAYKVRAHNSFGDSAYLELGAIVVSEVVFSVDFSDGNLVPEIGTSGSFSRASGERHADTLTSLALKTSGNACVEAFPLNGAGSDGGIQISAPTRNQIVRSEAPATTWAAIGSPTVTNAVGTFLGILSYGTIAPAAPNEGIRQASGLGAAANDFCFSVYMSVESGTAPVTLTIDGSTGGTPEVSTKQVTVTTTPQRFFFIKRFTASATGNCRVAITVDDTTTIRVAGMQLEQHDAATYKSSAKAPKVYVATTSTTNQTVGDILTYTGTELTSLSTTFSISCWVNTPYSHVDFWNNDDVKLFWNTSAHAAPYACMGLNSSGNSIIRLVLDADEIKIIDYTLPSWTANVWHHLLFIFDYTEGVFLVVKDGESLTILADDSEGVEAPTLGGIQFGGEPHVTDSRATLDGIISRFKAFAHALQASNGLSIYNAEKSNYGL